MLPSAMVVEIEAHDFDTDDPRIYALLTAENRRLCALGPWPFTEKTATWTETYNQANAGLPLVGAPADLRAVRALGMPEIADNQGWVSYLRRDLIRRRYGSNSLLLRQEPVRHYYVFGNSLYIWPYIEANRIFQLDYHADPPVLGAGTTEAQMLLPDEYAPILMDRVLARLSRAEGDLADGNEYDGRATSALAEMMTAYDINMDSPDPMILTDDGFYD